jgi:hypothetical protein
MIQVSLLRPGKALKSRRIQITLLKSPSVRVSVDLSALPISGRSGVFPEALRPTELRMDGSQASLNANNRAISHREVQGPQQHN